MTNDFQKLMTAYIKKAFLSNEKTFYKPLAYHKKQD